MLFGKRMTPIIRASVVKHKRICNNYTLHAIIITCICILFYLICFLIQVAVVAHIGSSDHSSLSAVISMAQAVPNLCVSRKVFLKHKVNWNTVCGAMRDLPWHNIWSSDNPVEVLKEHLSLLVGRYVPTKIIRVRNKDKPWFDDLCRCAFDLKQEAYLRWTRDHSRVNWEEFVCCRVRANETYSKAKHQFSVRNINILMNVLSPHT